MEKSISPQELLTLSKRQFHPFQNLIMLLCVVTGIPILLGKAPAPASLEAALPQNIVFLWAAAISLGAILCLLGTFFHARVNGLLTEQLGLVMVGVACLFYAGVAFLTLGISAGVSVPSGIIAACGVACLWRWRQIQQFLKLVALVAASNGDSGEK